MTRNTELSIPDKNGPKGWLKTTGTLIAIVFVVAIAVIGSGIVKGVTRSMFGSSTAELLAAVVALALVWVGLSLLLVKGLRFTFRDLGMTLPSSRRRLGLGFVTGIGSALLALGSAYLLGAFEFRWSAGAVSYGFVTALVLSTCIHAYFEEVAFRAGLVGAALRRFPRVVAVAIPAVLFGLGHLGNEGASLVGVLNTVILGIALGFMFLPSSADGEPSLGLATGWHAGWNLAVAFCGVRVSGNERYTWLVAEPRGSEWVNGGDYGIEASVTTTAVGLCVLAVVLYFHFRPRR